jgi:hypothetical protein
MTWAKIDDQFYLGLKNAAIDRDEQDIYLASLVYCNGQLTDGFIPESALMLLYVWAKIPIEANAQANAQAIASRLVEHNFWECADNGYQVHDFLDWNLSKVEVLELSKVRADAGRLGGQRSAEKRRAKALAKAQFEASAQANAQAKGQANSNPVPVPVPVPVNSFPSEKSVPKNGQQP